VDAFPFCPRQPPFFHVCPPSSRFSARRSSWLLRTRSQRDLADASIPLCSGFRQFFGTGFRLADFFPRDFLLLVFLPFSASAAVHWARFDCLNVLFFVRFFPRFLAGPEIVCFFYRTYRRCR